jgi:hypothetical protein
MLRKGKRRNSFLTSMLTKIPIKLDQLQIFKVASDSDSINQVMTANYKKTTATEKLLQKVI